MSDSGGGGGHFLAGSALLRMLPDFSGFASKVKDQLSGVARQSEGVGRKVASSLAGPLKIAAGVGLERAGEAAIDFGKESVAAFQASEEASTKLQDAYGRFPKLQDVTRASLDKLATSLSEHTKFSKVDLQAAEGQLAQYSLTGSQLERLTPLVADFAARTGRDLPSAATAVGKALLGNTKALKDIGINYKTTHNAAKDYVNIQSLLTEKVGGFANKQGKTAAGLLAIMSHRFEEMKVKIGAALIPVLSILLKALAPLFPVFTKIVDVIAKALQPVMGALGRAFGQVIKALIPLLEPISQLLLAFVPIIPVVAQLAAMLISTLVPVLIPVIKFVTDLVTALLQNKVILTIVAAAVLAFIGPLGAVGTAIAILVALVVKHWTTIKDFITGAVSTVVNFVKRNWPLIVSIITGPLGALVLFVVRHWDQIKHVIGSAIDRIKTVVSHGIRDVVSFFLGLPGKIFSAIGDLGKRFYDIGRNALNSLISGAKSIVTDSSWGHFWEGVGGSATDIVENALGIHSPSRVFSGIGKNIVQGLIEGVEGHAPHLAKVMDRFSQTVGLNGAMSLKTPGFDRSLAFVGAAPSGAVINHYNLTMHTLRDVGTLRQDYRLLEAMG